MELADSKNRFTRIRSDYLGAGRYVVADDGEGVYVNTSYGVQAVGLDGKARWRLELVERCLGLARRPDGVLLANTLHAAHQIDPAGKLLETSPTRYEITTGPVPYEDGMLLFTRTRVYALDAAGKARWKFRFRESLGKSVRAVLIVGAFPLGDRVVVGAVDYNTGVGRVFVLDGDGQSAWQSDVGPLTDIFAVEGRSASSGTDFVYTFSGYGRFESFCSGLDGRSHWKLAEGGPGLGLADGRMVMLVGNNEAPTWDDWHFRILSADGATAESRAARGRACHAPVEGPDGRFYFSSFIKPIDLAESRIEYTSYVRQPCFQAFDHLFHDSQKTPVGHDVFYFAGDGSGRLELLFEDTETQAFGPPVAGPRHVFFVHGHDLLALPVESTSKPDRGRE